MASAGLLNYWNCKHWNCRNGSSETKWLDEGMELHFCIRQKMYFLLPLHLVHQLLFLHQIFSLSCIFICTLQLLPYFTYVLICYCVWSLIAFVINVIMLIMLVMSTLEWTDNAIAVLSPAHRYCFLCIFVIFWFHPSLIVEYCTNVLLYFDYYMLMQVFILQGMVKQSCVRYCGSLFVILRHTWRLWVSW